MELHQALVVYRAHIEKVLGNMDPPATQEWLTETADRCMAKFTDGNGDVTGRAPSAANPS